MLQHPLHHELSEASMVDVVLVSIEQHLLCDELLEAIFERTENQVLFLEMVLRTTYNISSSPVDPTGLWVTSSL